MSGSTEASKTRAEVTLKGTEAWTTKSSLVDQDFEISVAVLGAAGGGPYPVMYVVDANTGFATTVQIARLLQLGQEVPPLILVGIGYPIGSTLNDDEATGAWAALRARDLTPTPLPDEHAHAKGSGGGRAFLGFITDELMPEVNRSYPADPGDCGILGDSFGGLFAVYSMLIAPMAFRRYVAGSPALMYSRDFLYEAEAALAETPSILNAKLFMGAGTLEHELMVSGVKNMAERLARRNYPGLEVTTAILDDETHVSVWPAMVSRGLRAVYR